MPNTAVKPANAESTWGEAPWEDRKPLILIKKALAYASAFLWFVIRDSWLVGNERLPMYIIFSHNGLTFLIVKYIINTKNKSKDKDVLGMNIMPLLFFYSFVKFK